MIKVRRSLIIVKRGLAQETQETKVMLATYHRYTKGQATKLEMKEANQQFLDVIRGLGLGVVVVLPFSPITIPAIVKLGEKVGVDVLPSSFKGEFSKTKDSSTNIEQTVSVAKATSESSV